MKFNKLLILVTFITLFTGCATVTPIELVNARLAYIHARENPSAELVPAELHKAHEALDLAEKSFLEEQSFLGDSISYKTKDLAYVAQRKAELAETLAIMAADKGKKEKAGAEFQSKQAEIVKQGKQDLIDSEKRTADMQETANFTEYLLQVEEGKTEVADLAADKASEEKIDAELKQDEIVKQGKQDLINSEKRTTDALAELARLTAVKEEERGLVVTLSGSVLFKSEESTLLSSAQTTIEQISNALLSVPARNLIVEGHTDSQGSESYNQDLSQRRAEAVRDYIMKRGYPANRIQARGMGEGRPIANNDSPEGRANNRRVEIIIEPELHTSNE